MYVMKTEIEFYNSKWLNGLTISPIELGEDIETFMIDHVTQEYKRWPDSMAENKPNFQVRFLQSRR